MTGGRVVVLGDPGPWLCSGMTGGVVYVRQNPDWNLDESAVRRRLSKAAKVSLQADRGVGRRDDRGAARGLPAGAARRRAGRRRPTGSQPLIDDPAEHFVAIIPVTQQADPNISTE